MSVSGASSQLDPAQLAALAAVVAEGSFEAAARALHVTPSAVSQRIKALEQTVGQVLVRRGRPCAATAAGRPLLRLAGQIALLEREALQAARGRLAGGPRTRLAIVVNADSLATWFLPALAEVLATTELAVEIREDDQDYTADLLRDGSVMAAVTAQNEPVQGCRVQRLGAMRYLAVATPAFVERHLRAPANPVAEPSSGSPVTEPSPAELVDALADAPMLVFSRKDQLQHRFLRALTRRRLDPPVHYVPSVVGFNAAIGLGLGWGMMPAAMAADGLATGRYVELVPGRHLDVPLYWQHWRLDSAVLHALTAAVRRAAATALR